MKVNLLNLTDTWKKPFLKGFSSRRLYIQPMAEKDIPLVMSTLMSSENLFYLKNFSDTSDVEKWLRDVFGKKDYSFFLIEPNNVEVSLPLEPVGFLMLNRRSSTEIEIGGVIEKNTQGQGYAEEVTKALILFIRQNENHTYRLYAEIHKDNSAAEKVLQVQGFLRHSLSDKGKRAFILDQE